MGSHVGIQVGEDGATHQALEDIAIMRVIPNMKVFCPADAIETKNATKSFGRLRAGVYIVSAASLLLKFMTINMNFILGRGAF